MRRNKKGNILLITFIMLTSLAVIAGSFSFVITIMIKRAGVNTRSAKAFYYAEAGLAKAIWYLKTPTYLGGKDSTWRVTNFTENVGEGSYKLTVENGATPIEVKITSQGKFGTTTRTLQARFQTYPPAFGYAIFSQQKISADHFARISGNVFADADVFIDTNAMVYNGSVVVTPATPEHTVTGGGSYATSPMPVPAPLFPTLETQYYDTRLANAALVAPGDKTYHSLYLDLGGGTLNVNGNVRIRPWSIFGFGVFIIITGPGEIVATGSITTETPDGGLVYISDNIKLISGNDLDIRAGSNIGHDSVLFGRDSISLRGEVNNEPIVSFFTPKDLYLYNGAYVTGIINAGRATYSPASIFLGSAQIGNYGGTQVNIGQSARSYHYYSKLPAVAPPGIPFVYIQVPGSWQEL
jgi:hypothetical protein